MLQNRTCTKVYEVHCLDAGGRRQNNYFEFSSSYSHVDVVNNSDDQSYHFGRSERTQTMITTQMVSNVFLTLGQKSFIPV